MRYCLAKLSQAGQDKAYRVYVTDTLKLIAKNTAALGGEYLNKRFIDLIDSKADDPRTGAEIAADVIKSAGLTLIKDT